jgi:hypothetical protein
VGGLAYYLEAEGISTTQISLIREHTEFIRPPRALWVPFELGRPLGAPNNPELQRQILLSALELLEAPEGPVLSDFPDEKNEFVTEDNHEPELWACPVSFAPVSGQETDIEKTISAFRREVTELRPWYDIGLQSRDRTAVGNFDSASASELFIGYLEGRTPLVFPDGNFAFPVALRLASQDLKSFYFEAAISRPGATVPGSTEFNRWFWQETAAGKILKAVKERCLGESDKALRLAGTLLLVPMSQA